MSSKVIKAEWSCEGDLVLKVTHANWGPLVTLNVNGQLIEVKRPDGIDPNGDQGWGKEVRITLTGDDTATITWTDTDSNGNSHSSKDHELVVKRDTECEVTTTTQQPTTTTAATTTTAGTTTTGSPTTVIPTTAAPATTVFITTTTSGEPVGCCDEVTTIVTATTQQPTTSTLPATGSNSTPLVMAGVGFLAMGSIAVLKARRVRPA